MPLSFSDPPKQNAAYLAHLASAAYKDIPQTYDSWDKLGLSRCQIFSSDNMATKGFVGMDDSDIFVAFRGTDDVKDMITDLNILMVKGYGGRVHKGFADALESVWSRVQNALKIFQKEKPNAKIWVTGHSLGGALAILSGQRLVAEKWVKPEQVAVFTFGQPKVGDKTFSDNYPANLCRFYHRYDIVPAVPPPELTPDFTHVGQHLWLSGKVGIVQEKPFNWVPLTVQAAITQLLQTIRTPNRTHWVALLGGAILVQKGIKDHGMSNYIALLKDIMKK